MKNYVQLNEKELKKHGWKKERNLWSHKLKSKILELKDEESPSRGFIKAKLMYQLDCDYKNEWWLMLLSSGKFLKVIGEVKLKDCNIEDVYNAAEPDVETYNKQVERLAKLKFIPRKFSKLKL